MHGVGPLVTPSPTRLEMPLVQQLDVTQYRQDANMWQIDPVHANMCGSDQPQTPFQHMVSFIVIVSTVTLQI